MFNVNTYIATAQSSAPFKTYPGISLEKTLKEQQMYKKLQR